METPPKKLAINSTLTGQLLHYVLAHVQYYEEHTSSPALGIKGNVLREGHLTNTG
jgi:hypothetical protein